MYLHEFVDTIRCMISKKMISDIRALHLDKHRKEQQLFIAEGEKVVRELLNSEINVKMLFATGQFDVSEIAIQPQTEFHEITEAELQKISLLHTPNKVIAIAERPTPQVFNFKTTSSLILLLDGIKDPGNLGTLIRTADWFGLRTIFCSEDCVDTYNPKVVQSAMGSLFRMNVYYESLPEVIARAKLTGGYLVTGASADGIPYYECETRKPMLLVIGSESHGMSPGVLKVVDVKAGIPRAPGSVAESLNAGIAGALLMAHFQNPVK